MNQPIETIAVTGASGHLGTAIVLEALNRGLVVRAGYGSYKPDLSHPNLIWIQGDLSVEPITALVGDAQAIIHSAAKISVDGDKDGSVMKTNVEGTRHVAEVCVTKNIRMIQVSSTHAAKSLPHDEVYDESRPMKTADGAVYDYSKALSEEAVLSLVATAQLDGLIVRPSGMIGPPDLRASMFSSTLLNLYNGKVPALITGGYDVVDVRDVASGTLNALALGRKGEVYLLAGNHYGLTALANMLHELGGAKPPITLPIGLVMALLPLIDFFSKLITGEEEKVFTKESLVTFRDGHPNISNKKAQDELNYHPRPIKESLAELIAWWKEEGMTNK